MRSRAMPPLAPAIHELGNWIAPLQQPPQPEEGSGLDRFSLVKSIGLAIPMLTTFALQSSTNTDVNFDPRQDAYICARDWRGCSETTVQMGRRHESTDAGTSDERARHSVAQRRLAAADERARRKNKLSKIRRAPCFLGRGWGPRRACRRNPKQAAINVLGPVAVICGSWSARSHSQAFAMAARHLKCHHAHATQRGLRSEHGAGGGPMPPLIPSVRPSAPTPSTCSCLAAAAPRRAPLVRIASWRKAAGTCGTAVASFLSSRSARATAWDALGGGQPLERDAKGRVGIGRAGLQAVWWSGGGRRLGRRVIGRPVAGEGAGGGPAVGQRVPCSPPGGRS